MASPNELVIQELQRQIDAFQDNINILLAICERRHESFVKKQRKTFLKRLVSASPYRSIKHPSQTRQNNMSEPQQRKISDWQEQINWRSSRIIELKNT